MRAGLIIALLLLAASTIPSARAASATEALASGWETYRLSEFDRSIRFFEEAVQQAKTGSAERAQALYGLGTTWNLRRPGEDRKKAESFFRQALAESPSGEAAAWTSLALARMLHLVPVGEEPDLPAVRLAYEHVIRDHPDHLVAREAFIYKMATFIASLEETQTRYAIANLQRFVRRPGAREFLQPAWSLMAVGFTTLNQQEERLYAEIMALKTTETDPSNPFTEFAWAYWNIATIAEFEVGDFALARQFYRRLIEQYPRDIKVYGARAALQRMDEVEKKLRGPSSPRGRA